MFFSVICIFWNQKSICFDMEKHRFLLLIDFENFEVFEMSSFFIIFGVTESRAFWIFRFFYSTAGSESMLSDTFVSGEKWCLSKTNCQTYLEISCFDLKKCKRLSHRKPPTSCHRPHTWNRRSTGKLVTAEKAAEFFIQFWKLNIKNPKM